MHYRYQRVISTRTSKNDIDLDEYGNLYKYQKNVKNLKAKFRPNRHQKKLTRTEQIQFRKVLQRKKGQDDERRFAFISRFKKSGLYQQLLSDFSETVIRNFGLLFRLRQPLRHLSFANSRFSQFFYKKIRTLAKQKYFINTVHHIVLLHYYKAVPSFSQHFGRELQKIRKKVH
jgi:hypothetical protein